MVLGQSLWEGKIGTLRILQWGWEDTGDVSSQRNLAYFHCLPNNLHILGLCPVTGNQMIQVELILFTEGFLPKGNTTQNRKGELNQLHSPHICDIFIINGGKQRRKFRIQGVIPINLFPCALNCSLTVYIFLLPVLMCFSQKYVGRKDCSQKYILLLCYSVILAEDNGIYFVSHLGQWRIFSC